MQPSATSKSRKLARRGALASLAAIALSASSMAAASASPADDLEDQIFGTHTVVASNLDNPRQLSLVGNGQLYIAEAGSGGANCMGEGDDITCIGNTGAISQILVPQFASNVTPKRIVTGLLSVAGPDGSFATGADGVSAASASEIYIAITGGPPEGPQPPGTESAGKLLKAGFLRAPAVFSDITAHEIAHNPDNQNIESNPYAVLVVNKNLTLVADAAANAIVAVNKKGVTSTFAVLPNVTGGDCDNRVNEDGSHSCDFVPTSLALGPDGGIYVGGLGAEAPGAGQVVELSSSGAIMNTWTEFTTVTGVAVADDGTLYVSELFRTEDPASGDVVKVGPNGMRTSIDVPLPAGLAVDSQNNLYVSAFSTSTSEGSFGPGTSGQVWRVRF